MSARNRNTSATQKFTALGIASATCVGLVGLVALRNAQDADPALTSATGLLSTTTLMQQQLDANAAQLLAEQQRLDTYRQQLADTAKLAAPVTTSAQTSSQSTSTSSAANPASNKAVNQRAAARRAASQKAEARKAASRKTRATATAAVAAQQMQQPQPPQPPQPQPQILQPQPQQQVQSTQGSTRASR